MNGTANAVGTVVNATFGTNAGELEKQMSIAPLMPTALVTTIERALFSSENGELESMVGGMVFKLK